MKYSRVLAIIEAHGFKLHRHDGSSHRRYRRVDEAGNAFYVDLTPHKWSDEVPRGTLGAIIRQSNLPRKLFRR